MCTNPQVSAVVITYNRLPDLRLSLERLLASTAVPLEVIVVYNGSRDGTADWLEQHLPQIQLIRLAQNRGVEAYNNGFQAARGSGSNSQTGA